MTRHVLDRRKATLAFFALLVAACGQAPKDADKNLSPEVEKYFAKLAAMNGRSGEFEGVYRPGAVEGSSFAFCTRDECPDFREMSCQPEFSGEAAQAMQSLWEKHSDEPIHLFATGVLRTGTKPGHLVTYGHLGEHECQITISRVRQPEVLQVPFVRSKDMPSLAIKPK